MGLTKTIEIDGKQVPFKASAAIPRIYRIKFHRDVYKDLAALEKAVGKPEIKWQQRMSTWLLVHPQEQLLVQRCQESEFTVLKQKNTIPFAS